MPQLIENGHLYFAVPPLYAIKQGKNLTYAYSDVERDAIISTLEGKYDVQRYKGLTNVWPLPFYPDSRQGSIFIG